MSESGRSREEKEAGWERFDAWFEEKPPISNRGVSFSPPSDTPSELPLCCQALERVKFYDCWVEEAFDNDDTEGLHTYNACYQEAVIDFENSDKCASCQRYHEDNTL